MLQKSNCLCSGLDLGYFLCIFHDHTVFQNEWVIQPAELMLSFNCLVQLLLPCHRQTSPIYFSFELVQGSFNLLLIQRFCYNSNFHSLSLSSPVASTLSPCQSLPYLLTAGKKKTKLLHTREEYILNDLHISTLSCRICFYGHCNEYTHKLSNLFLFTLIFCFLKVMNFNVYGSKRHNNVRSQHWTRRDKCYSSRPTYCSLCCKYQKLSLRGWEQCSFVFRVWLGFGCSHMLKALSPILRHQFPLLSWEVTESLYAFAMGSNNSCLSTAGSLRWQ